MNTLREEWEEEFAKHLGEYENHHRLHGESFYEWAIKFIHRINEAQRTADLEALREAWPKSPELYPCRPDDIPKERYECYAEQCDRCSFAGGQRKALSDTLSLIEQIKNKKI